MLSVCTTIVRTEYNPRDGRGVPSLDAVALSDGAVNIDAAVLYADLAKSTDLVDGCRPDFAADVTRVFLYVAAQCIRKCGGRVTSFDGDRVMGVFVEGSFRDNAAMAAFALRRAVNEVVLPSLRSFWDLEASPWKFNYGVGLDSSSITVVRAGPRGANDLVWLGSAANHAAILSNKRDVGYSTYATPRFVEALTSYTKNNDGSNVWENIRLERYYRSSSYLTDLDSIV